MNAPKNILVPTDFGAAADTALRYARALAHAFGSTLHVMHVRENTFLRATAADPRDLHDAVFNNLQQLLTDEDRRVLRGRAVVETSDRPAEAIVEYARTAAIDWIVMGTRGRTGVNRALMGSVAERVVRTSTCPVLTVRHPEREFLLPDVGGADQASPDR